MSGNEANGKSGTSDELKYGSALWVVVLGLLTVLAVIWMLAIEAMWASAQVAALVGAITTFLGTALGTILGAQVSKASAEQADDRVQRLVEELVRALKDR